MIRATVADGSRRSPHHGGERATCPSCDAVVIAVCGEIVVWHWRHYAKRDCDSWAEGETNWHANWKGEAKDAGFEIEVTFREPIHRADAVSPTGVIYEFQHSGMDEDKLDDRDCFYDDRGPLVWVFDAKGPWTKRWHKWREEGQSFHQGVMALDEDRTVWLLLPDGKTRSISPWDLFSEKVQRLARREWTERRWRCATCGAAPVAFFPDGTGTSRCSHSPVLVPASAG